MKIQNKKTTLKLPLIIIASLLLVGIGGYALYAKANESWPFTSNAPASQATPSSKDEADSDDNKTETDQEGAVSKTPIQNDDIGSDVPDENSTDPRLNGNSVSVTMSLDKVDSSVRVRTLIKKITESGTCKLRITKGSAVIKRESGIQALPSSSTCKGFDIPINQLSPGTWSFVVSIETGKDEGTASAPFVVE